MAHLARVAHLAPALRTWGLCWFQLAAHPKTTAGHVAARLLAMRWKGGWESAKRLASGECVLITVPY
eukprot:1952266-Pyramimonas_sp.AAC.1